MTDIPGTVRLSPEGDIAVRADTGRGEDEYANWSVTLVKENKSTWRLFSSVQDWRMIYCPSGEDADLVHFLRKGLLIHAIKRHRELTGMSLKDSKHFCETHPEWRSGGI